MAGGGGDVLVVAPAHTGFTGHLSAAGGVDYAVPSADGKLGKITGIR